MGEISIHLDFDAYSAALIVNGPLRHERAVAAAHETLRQDAQQYSQHTQQTSTSQKYNQNKQPFLSLQRKCAARSSGFVVYVNSKQQKIVHCVAVGRPPKLSCEIIFYPSFFGIDPQMRLSLALLACAVSTVDASSLNDIEHIVVFMQVGQHIVTPTSFLVFSFLSFPLFCSNYCRITTAATSCAFRHSFPLERRADCTSAKS